MVFLVCLDFGVEVPCSRFGISCFTP
ncbi:TPA: DUF3265 domain-containing protein [Vibrio parahaemolyticus]|nr:DUF3265 domain-containing protein [Vibrio parahaemolyticus]